MQIEERVAVVTGAGSGIGLAIAESLANAGARVVVSDINATTACYAAERITAAGNLAIARQADACIAEDIRRLCDDASSQFGPVDIYIANAGIAGPPGLGWDEQEWDRALEIILHAHVRAASVLVPEWMKRGSGHFVSIASAAGLLTLIGAAAYTVTKHAAVAFAEWLAITHGDDGIGVSCVCPMGVNTRLLSTALSPPTLPTSLWPTQSSTPEWSLNHRSWPTPRWTRYDTERFSSYLSRRYETSLKTRPPTMIAG